MKGARVRSDGRKTFKQKPGPKPKQLHEGSSWAALIVFHALKSSPRLRRRVLPPSEDGHTDRQLASISLAVTAVEVEWTVDRERYVRRLSVIRLRNEDSNADIENIFDWLIGRHRKIMRQRASATERRRIERCADMLCRSAFPHRAAFANRPLLFTPVGVFGEARAWPLRAAEAAARRTTKGVSSWEKVAAMAGAYQNRADDEGPRLAQKATAELRAVGFPIDEVLKRLNL